MLVYPQSIKKAIQIVYIQSDVQDMMKGRGLWYALPSFKEEVWLDLSDSRLKIYHPLKVRIWLWPSPRSLFLTDWDSDALSSLTPTTQGLWGPLSLTSRWWSKGDKTGNLDWGWGDRRPLRSPLMATGLAQLSRGESSFESLCPGQLAIK